MNYDETIAKITLNRAITETILTEIRDVVEAAPLVALYQELHDRNAETEAKIRELWAWKPLMDIKQQVDAYYKENPKLDMSPFARLVKSGKLVDKERMLSVFGTTEDEFNTRIAKNPSEFLEWMVDASERLGSAVDDATKDTIGLFTFESFSESYTAAREYYGVIENIPALKRHFDSVPLMQTAWRAKDQKSNIAASAYSGYTYIIEAEFAKLADQLTGDPKARAEIERLQTRIDEMKKAETEVSADIKKLKDERAMLQGEVQPMRDEKRKITDSIALLKSQYELILPKVNDARALLGQPPLPSSI